MSALKIDELQPGVTVFLVAIGGGVVEGKVVTVKRRASGKPQVCVETSSAIVIEEYYPDRFFPSAKEAWYAVAMFAQRKVQELMGDAAKAFQKAGISPEPETPAAS